MSRKTLIDKLNKVTDKAATIAIKRGYPIPISKKLSLVGNLCIEKNKDGFYDIKTTDKKVLYENIFGYDIAVVIAQRFNQGEISAIKKVLSIEEDFIKYHTDMVHYLNCMRTAKKNKDYDRLFILEDKFQLAEMHAKNIKDRLTSFKRAN